MAVAPQPADTSATAVGDSSAYQVAYNPNLEWMVSDMNSCQSQIADFQINYEQAASLTAASGTYDVYLSYGTDHEIGAELYQIGSDRLVAAVNPGRGMQLISTGLLGDIFSGRISTWGEAYAACPGCFTSDLSASSDPITVWMLPEDSGVWSAFAAFYLGSPVSSFARIAPNARIMRQMLAADVNTIGVLSAGWLDDSINALTFGGDNSEPVTLPILAATHAEPDAPLSQWLTCVQNALP
jgi:ABC-type phosphate transport system substrate-binding protein